MGAHKGESATYSGLIVCGHNRQGGAGVCGAPVASKKASCQHHAKMGFLQERIKAAVAENNKARWSIVGTELEKHYARALADETILDPIQDLALMDASISQALEKSKEFDSPEWRRRVKMALDRLKKANSGGDQAAFARALGDLDSEVEHGATQAELIELVFDMVDRRSERLRRIRETEVKLQQVITMRDMVQIFARLVIVAEEQLSEEDCARVIPAWRDVLAGQMQHGDMETNSDDVEQVEAGDASDGAGDESE